MTPDQRLAEVSAAGARAARQLTLSDRTAERAARVLAQLEPQQEEDGTAA
jgi:hypothetical protein